LPPPLVQVLVSTIVAGLLTALDMTDWSAAPAGIWPRGWADGAVAAGLEVFAWLDEAPAAQSGRPVTVEVRQVMADRVWVWVGLAVAAAAGPAVTTPPARAPAAARARTGDQGL